MKISLGVMKNCWLLPKSSKFASFKCVGHLLELMMMNRIQIKFLISWIGSSLSRAQLCAWWDLSCLNSFLHLLIGTKILITLFQVTHLNHWLHKITLTYTSGRCNEGAPQYLLGFFINVSCHTVVL